MVFRRRSISSLWSWLAVAVLIASLITGSRSGAPIENEWDAEPETMWATESKAVDPSHSWFPETATVGQTRNSTTLEELYALTPPPEPDGNSDNQGVYAPYATQPGISPLGMAPRVGGKKRIITGILLVSVGLMLLAYYVDISLTISDEIYESLERHGFSPPEKDFPEEARAAAVLDRVASSFFLFHGALAVLLSGLISRHRGKAKATQWLMQQVANTVADLPHAHDEPKANGEEGDEEWAHEANSASQMSKGQLVPGTITP